MKLVDCERGVSQVDSWLPGVLRVIVADPIHEVVQLAVPKLGVEDLVNLELGKPVHLSGQGRGHDTARERGGHVQLQQADMEHRMDLHGAWQQELVGRSPDGPDDWVKPKTTNIPFGRRAPGGDMSAKQPHFLTWSKIWCRSATPIRGELHRFPSF